MKTNLMRRLFVGLAVVAVTAASYAQWSNPADDVPAYHASAPLRVSALPPILAGAKLKGENFRYPWQVHAYQQAAKVGNVLYQLPCNCRCDREVGHTSLRSCYETLHATACSICAKERGHLRLPADEAGQDTGTDSQRNRTPRVREHRFGEAVIRFRGIAPGLESECMPISQRGL